MAPAANIDEVIAFASPQIAAVSYGGVDSLFAKTTLWIDGLFGEAGPFPPSLDSQRTPGQRTVTNWYAAHVMARADIEGPGIGDSGVVGTSEVINAVERVASAVKFAAINADISGAQQTAFIALYNTIWP